MTNKLALKKLCIENNWGIYGIPASAEEYSPAKTRYLRITDISDDGDLLDNDKKSVSAPDIKKYFLREGDIVFARTGNSTGRTYYHEEKNGELAFAGFLIKYSLDKSKVIPKFLKFYTLSKEYKTWVQNLSVGSTRGNINAQTFADCPITIPGRDQQELLVRVLSSLTDKNYLDKKINITLQALAKTIYDYWFVQFDFPDANGKPYKSSGGKMVYSEVLKREIPKDWSVKTLSEITPTATESVNPAKFPDKVFKHLSIPSFDAVGSFFEEEGETIGSNKFKVCSTDILVSKLNPKFSRVIYVTNEEDLISSTEFVVWRPENQKLKPFLYSVAKDPSFISFCQQSASGTSNSHKRINPTVMMDYQIAYNQDVCELFGKHIESSIKKMMINNLETKQLTSLRDWLLPMLMNGQIRVN